MPKGEKMSRFLKFLRSDLRVCIGGFLLVLIFLLALFAPFFAPYDPNENNLKNRLIKPGSQYLLGTDEFGRDITSRLIWGGRVSLAVGLLVVMGSLIIGCTAGTIAGFFGGVVDSIIMRLVDILLAFPAFLLALALVATMGSSLSTVVLSISIAYSPRIALVMRGIILSVRETIYVEASRAFGAGNLWIIMKHIIPNSLPPMIVIATVSAATAITAEAGLSFLGLGVQPPTPTWGSIISDGQNFIRSAPWISFSAGFLIMITVVCLNLVGDALRDIQDPRLKGSMRNV